MVRCTPCPRISDLKNILGSGSQTPLIAEVSHLAAEHWKGGETIPLVLVTIEDWEGGQRVPLVLVAVELRQLMGKYTSTQSIARELRSAVEGISLFGDRGSMAQN